MTAQAAEPARRPREASSGHRMSTVLVGLAVAARIARYARTYEAAIVVVIAVAAVAGLGKSSRANSWARLVEWDKRRRASDHGPAKAGKSIAAK